MLLFSTILDIKEGMGKNEFINSVLTWSSSSPDSENIISAIEWQEQKTLRYEKGSLWIEISHYECENIIAIRYEKIGVDGVVSSNDYIMNFNKMKLCIQLGKSCKEDIIINEADFSTPYYIKWLIDNNYVKADKGLAISGSPVLINDDNLNLLADLIKGNTRYKLPAVYVSKTIFNTDPLEVIQLAESLKGAAHVLVQEDRASNAKCRLMCENNNEFNGAVGIYYPNPAVLKKRYLYKSYSGSDKVLLNKVIKDVIAYLNFQNIEKLYTWHGVNNALLHDNLNSQIEKRIEAEKARQSAENEKDMVYDSFDDEIKKLRCQVEELSKNNDILKYENQGLRDKISGYSTLPVLYFGSEEGLFTDEVKDIILSSLEEILKRTPEKTRRWDVLNDIISSNDFKHINEEKQKIVKRLFRGYEYVSVMMRQELASIGFELKEEGKHYKILYYGDERYWTAISKTPSDGRSGKNIAQTIIKTML